MEPRTAKFDTTCRACRAGIQKGDIISRGKGPIRCLKCGAANVEALRESEPRKPRVSKAPARLPGKPLVEHVMATQTQRISYDCVGDAIANLLDDFAQNDTNREKIRSGIREVEGQSWVGGRTSAGLKEVLANPGAQILDAIERMRSEITEAAVPAELRRHRRRGCESGDEIDSGRFLDRIPEMWDRTERQSMPKRMVWIGVNALVHSGQKQADLLWRGAAAVALADQLTLAGYSVGVLYMRTVFDLTTHIKLSSERIVVKAPDAPMDLPAIATACCDIGFSRFIGIFGQARHAPGRLDSAYGHCRNMPQSERADVDYFVDYELNTKEKAIDWLRRSLAAASDAKGAEHV